MFKNVFLIFTCIILPKPSYMNPEKSDLLAGTLKTMQRASCDDEIVSFACPNGTLINLQVAQYGKATPENQVCKAKVSEPNSEVGDLYNGDKCLWPNAMQYSLLQTVVEACQKKRRCKFSTKLKLGSVDPCPLSRKFIELAYKCRPQNFRSRTACENDTITITCSHQLRIAILFAQYGRTAHDSITCPQTVKVGDETCTASFATEKVMQMCHGRRQCTVFANHNTFGNPCQLTTRTYLKIVYTCVPFGVLKEKYESRSADDEFKNFPSDSKAIDDLLDNNEEKGEKWSEPNESVPFVNSELFPLDHGILNHRETTVDFTDMVKNKQFSEKNISEKSDSTLKLLIYIIVSVVIFVAVIMIAIGIRYIVVNRKKNNEKTNDMFSTETPNIFGDGLSDIDNDVDVSHISGTFYDPGHPDMILYKDIQGTRTIRAMQPLSTVYPTIGSSMYGNVDFVQSQSRENPTNIFNNDKKVEGDIVVSPKSLRGYSNSQFFYG